MAKFKKKAKAKQDIPTSALPDIIFMLLFFFMVTTVLRENTINVLQHIPKATELRKLQRKSLVSYLYVGKPRNTAKFGDEPKIQANDVFIEVRDIGQWIEKERAKLDEVERDQITIALKSDKDVKMGLISDIQMELRKANARKLMYSTPQRIDK
ncbi:MAG TPA: biopolymer transporter ExbD [Flammeovirgaceae bacterium]|nr:biopolymer transporter ExbD [Flammeovirgaceae bacterium]